MANKKLPKVSFEEFDMNYSVADVSEMSLKSAVKLFGFTDSLNRKINIVLDYPFGNDKKLEISCKPKGSIGNVLWTAAKAYKEKVFISSDPYEVYHSIGDLYFEGMQVKLNGVVTFFIGS
jgi:hypothetical protein